MIGGLEKGKGKMGREDGREDFNAEVAEGPQR
jgi:hypothetical protein